MAEVVFAARHGLAHVFADLGVLALHGLGDGGKRLLKGGQEVGLGDRLGLEVLSQGKLGGLRAGRGLALHLYRKPAPPHRAQTTTCHERQPSVPVVG